MFLDTEKIPMNSSGEIFFSLLAISILAGITVFLYFRAKRERKSYRQEMAELMEGVLSKNEIHSFINTHISKVPKDRSFPLIYIDFDHFNDLINAFGEENGQKILDDAMRHIRNIFPTRIQIGRIGFDQFLILIKEDFDRNQTINFANAIKEQANQPVKVYSDTIINPSVSIAIGFYPMHGRSLKEMMKSLDITMYTIKQKGGNQVSVYSQELGQKESENLQYYYELKEAIKSKQFVLYYQPIINISDNTIYGFEGLLRWRHPTLGVLTPGNFINILEQSGDINWIGAWGVETLIKEYVELKKQFVYKELQLSLNLSPKELLNETIAVSFQRILKKYRISPKCITIEIVEFAIFEKHEVVFENIKSLKELGFKIAVDGVGIDQNTLSKLGQSPIDIIKLDSNYLFSEDNSYIQNKYMELLIDFTKQTDRIVICEGIENVKIIEKVRQMGINLIQGYLVSPPISPESVMDYVKNESEISKKLDPNYISEVINEKEANTDSDDSIVVTESIDEKTSKKKTDKKNSNVVLEDDTNVISEDKLSIEENSIITENTEIIVKEDEQNTIADALVQKDNDIKKNIKSVKSKKSSKTELSDNEVKTENNESKQKSIPTEPIDDKLESTTREEKVVVKNKKPAKSKKE